MALDPRTLPMGPALSFGDNVAAWADNAALWLSNPLSLDQFAASADAPAAVAVTAPKAPAELGAAVGDAVDGAKKTALILAAWGGVALVGVALLQKLEK